MKRFIVATYAILAGFVCAIAAEVTVKLPSNKLVLCTYPFTNTNIRAQEVSNLFRDVKGNIQISTFSTNTMSFVTHSRNATSWLSGSGTNVVRAGEGFFVRQLYTNEVSIIFTGYVISATSYPVSIVYGLTMPGYPYPADRIISQMAGVSSMSPKCPVPDLSWVIFVPAP